ncbi:hypothetical protein SNE40_000301 [Patella caerulea]|uniref:Uncharacterized protein n=1 Tax=Patella caerulea TaxID=87958 RepID=A0AAN8KGQ1_PATCE
MSRLITALLIASLVACALAQGGSPPAQQAPVGNAYGMAPHHGHANNNMMMNPWIWMLGGGNDMMWRMMMMQQFGPMGLFFGN